MSRLTVEEYNDIVKKIANGMSIRTATETEKKRHAFRNMRKKIEAGTLVIPEDVGPVLENNEGGVESSLAPQLPDDVSTEELLKAARIALYQAMKKASPPPAYINLVFKLCEATLPEWSTNKQAHKEGVEEYKSILADLLNDPVKTFEIVSGGKEPERKIANG